MKKYDLKLFQSNSDGYNFKRLGKKNENILSIGVSVELKCDKVFISYKENEIKKCGFDSIYKVEIYKESSLICYVDRVQGFYVDFPYFSSEGIYEIRTTVENLQSAMKVCFISTFEFFSHKEKVLCSDFEIELSRINKDLYINFGKKFGDLDLSDIALSNITLFDSKGNQIKNIACKMYAKLNSMDFVVLDVFGDNSSNKLIPNEIYTLKIAAKAREMCSSFAFEYDNIEVQAYKIVEGIDYEVLSRLSYRATSLRLYIKINSLLNVDDYDYFISNIRSKFICFKSSQDQREDTVVFECVIKNQRNYFELSICKGTSVNVVRFDYEFDELGKMLINQVSYFDTPVIIRDFNKYAIRVNYNKCNVDLNSGAFLGISDEFGQLSIGASDKSFIERGTFSSKDEGSSVIVFENVSMLNKFSEIYTIEIDYETKESFIFSPSIGVKFRQIKCKTSILDNSNLKIEFPTGDNFHGRYVSDRGREHKLNIFDNVSTIKFKGFDNSQILYLKIYDGNNDIYFKTIILYNVELEAFVKISNGEKYLLDSYNHLTIVDKNIFDYFGEEFEVCLFSNDEELMKRNISIDNCNSKFKIHFDDFEISTKGMYYLKFKKGSLYKIYSFFVMDTYVHKKIFVRNFNESNIECILHNFVVRKFIKINIDLNIFMVVGEDRYPVFNGSLVVNSKYVKFTFPDNLFIDNTEYFIQFDFNKNVSRSTCFTYLGHRSGLTDIFDDMNELGDLLYFNSSNEREKVYENYTDIIINAYRIFLGFDVNLDSKEFILWKKLINDGKIDLRYFIKLFIIEHTLSLKLFNNELGRYEILDKILKFLNIDINLRNEFEVNRDIKNYDNFIDVILNNVCTTREYIIINDTFREIYE